MMREVANKIAYDYSGLDDAFPAADCGHTPLGEFVIVQIRTPKKTTKGGVLLPDEARETEHYNTQVAKVIAIGPLCFKRRDTGELWPEGAWFSVGDFVRVPKYGGDRWSTTFTRRMPESRKGNVITPAGEETGEAIFAMFKDRDCRAKVTGDPLTIKAWL